MYSLGSLPPPQSVTLLRIPETTCVFCRFLHRRVVFKSELRQPLATNNLLHKLWEMDTARSGCSKVVESDAAGDSEIEAAEDSTEFGVHSNVAVYTFKDCGFEIYQCLYNI